jgi:hypothetical protein
MAPMAERNVLLAAYGLGAGIVTTAAGLLASSGLHGAPQIAVWIVVTALLAIGAVLLAGPAVSFLGRLICVREDGSDE